MRWGVIAHDLTLQGSRASTGDGLLLTGHTEQPDSLPWESNPIFSLTNLQKRL